MPFAFIASATAADDASGATLDTTTSLNIAAGDVLVAWAKHELGSTSFAVAKNSGSPANTFTFDGADQIAHANNDDEGAFGYLLAAGADAAATFRLTLGAAKTFRRLIVLQFRTSGGTVTKDASNTGTGTSTAVATGQITTTGTDEIVVGGYGEYSTQPSTSELINGVSRDAVIRVQGTSTEESSAWYRILTAPFSGGTASATIGSHEWVAGVIAIKATSEAPGGWSLYRPYTLGAAIDVLTGGLYYYWRRRKQEKPDE